jgi:hypothetical protein
MTRNEAYSMWALEDSPWSDWAKPVLFSQMPPAWTHETARPLALPTAPPDTFAAKHTAIIADLPGDSAVPLALAFAARGFRPVPLYNGAAYETYAALGIPDSMEISSTIDAWRIMRSLWTGADLLEKIPLPPDAPPIFLLDSDRRIGQRAAIPGIFDNRWLAFPTDFPSASVLQSHGIEHAWVIAASPEVAADLTHTLLRWQQAQIAITFMQLGVDAAPRPITIRRPNLFRAAWYHFTATMSLRRRLLRGFGGVVPNPSSG